MKITAFGNNLVQLTYMGIVNCYFVREDDGLTLIDAGMSKSAAPIIKAAAQLGQPIRRITLTHAHGDHVGAFDDVAQQLPEAEVVLGKRTAVFLTGNHTLQPNEPTAKLRGTYVEASTKPSRTVVDGDQLGSLQIIATPGHTPDHIAFFDRRDGTLIAGDAFQTLGGVAVAGTLRWRFPLPALATWHKQTAVSSAKKLQALQPTRLAVGHGRVLEQPQAALAAAIQQAES